MSDELAWLNGRLIPRVDASLAIHDAGLVFGATVTDFCRTFSHQLFRWSAHLSRFRNDCRACFIPLQPDDSELTGIARELVAHNSGLIAPDQELALVSFATPGPLGFYAGAPGQDGPATLCLHTAPLFLGRYRPFFEEGIGLEILAPHNAPRDDLAPPWVKHRSRMHWWRADRLVKASSQFANRPSTVLALLGRASPAVGLEVFETAIGNLLIVLDGTVLAPPEGSVLEGISLSVVEELCRRLAIPFARERLSQKDCFRASEVMLSGSAFCLTGVRWIDGHDIPWPGPITRSLLAAWSDRVGIDIVAQILSAR